MKRLYGVAGSCILGVSLAYAWFQTPKGVPPESSKHEMTETDVLAIKNLDSTQLSVWGIHLGMSRAEADAVARDRGLQLFQAEIEDPFRGPVRFVPCIDANECGVMNSQRQPTGLAVRFGESQKVVQIIIDFEPTEKGPPYVTRSFKGQTRRFFIEGYSDALRLTLFGPENKRESVSGRYGDARRDTQFFYPARGLSVRISPRAIGYSGFDLIQVSLDPPTR